MNRRYDDLIAKEKERLSIRNSYKKTMIDSADSAENPGLPDNYVYFPKSVISHSNSQLRNGLPWLFNGFVLKINSNVLAVDPGVNFLLRLTESNFNVNSINNLFISHLHLDHSADANTLMDWMIRARANVKVMAPESVFGTKTISDFHSARKVDFPMNHVSTEIDDNKQVELGGGNMLSFIKLYHGVECFGFKLTAGDTVVTYISDTGYAKKITPPHSRSDINISDIKEPMFNASISDHYEDIKQFAKNSDLLIVNIDSFSYNKNSSTHMTATDLVHMLDGSSVKQAIIAHINPVGELTYENWAAEIATYVTEATGVKTHAPDTDGLVVAV